MFTPGTGKMSVSVTDVMTSFAISVNAALTISFSTLMFTPHMTAFAIRASPVISPVPVISFFFMFFPILLFFKVMFLLFSFFEMMVFIPSAEMMPAFRSFAGFPVFPFEMRMICLVFCRFFFCRFMDYIMVSLTVCFFQCDFIIPAYIGYRPCRIFCSQFGCGYVVSQNHGTCADG